MNPVRPIQMLSILKIYMHNNLPCLRYTPEFKPLIIHTVIREITEGKKEV